MCLHGFTQRLGIDFDETFIPIVKPATVCIVLSLAVSHDCPIHQLDVKDAFLHGTLQETVYRSQLSGFVDSTKPDIVFRLNKCLYGLKQGRRAWYNRFASFLFLASLTRLCSFITKVLPWSICCYMLMILSSQQNLCWTIIAYQFEFSMKDLGSLHQFLGICVSRRPTGLLLSQHQYCLEVLERIGMSDYKPCSTPVDTNAKLSSADDDPVADLTDYRSLAGALQYLIFTRPNISYAV